MVFESAFATIHCICPISRFIRSFSHYKEIVRTLDFTSGHSTLVLRFRSAGSSLKGACVFHNQREYQEDSSLSGLYQQVSMPA